MLQRALLSDHGRPPGRHADVLLVLVLRNSHCSSMTKHAGGLGSHLLRLRLRLPLLLQLLWLLLLLLPLSALSQVLLMLLWHNLLLLLLYSSLMPLLQR